MLDTRRLGIFVTVAQEGSFTAAADRLYLSQPAVSQQMAILEREVGLPLMDRMPRGIQLTTAGELLAERAQSILDSLTALEGELHRLVDAPRRVRLGAFSTAGAQLIPLTVRAYRERYPDAQLTVVSSRAFDVAGQLREGAIDIGLVWDYDFAPLPTDGDLRRTPVLSDPLRILLPVDHRLADRGELSLNELADDPWIVRDHRQPYHDAFETVCRIVGFEPHVVFRTEDYQAVQGLVGAGIGVSLVPQLCLTGERADVVALPVTSPAFNRRVAALSMPGSEHDQQLGQLLDILRHVGKEVVPT